MRHMYMCDELRSLLGSDVFAALWTLPGKTYRQVERRRTFRFVGPEGAAYFVKLHDGVGWPHILENLFILKPFVLGAHNEFAACRHLAAHGIRVPRAVGFGERGVNPATRRSFVICEALDDFVSLQDIAPDLSGSSTTLDIRRKMISEIALATRAMHAVGVNHRDYYIWHLMLNTRKFAASNEVELAIIDLHRAQVRRRVPDRWRKRDLAALLYSCWANRIGLNRRDWFRFVRDYTGERPAGLIRRQRRFWESVYLRSIRLSARRAVRKGRALCEQ